jgi:hypothetical protein
MANPNPVKSPGRTKKITNPRLVETFCKYIKLGCSIKGACGSVGISETAYRSYMHIAEKQLEEGIEDSLEIQFYNKVKQAEGDFETHNLELIQAKATDSWQAAAWLLERRRQQEYVIRQDSAWAVPDKITVKMDVTPEVKDE